MIQFIIIHKFKFIYQIDSCRVPKELPLFDYSLLEFFDILGVRNAIKLVICVLLEHQVRHGFVWSFLILEVSGCDRI